MSGLRVRNKELAQESRYIRLEEKRIQKRHKVTPCYYEWNGKTRRIELVKSDDKSEEYWKLRQHRTHDVRGAARIGLLAYAFLRGKKYRDVEPKTNHAPNYKINRLKQDVERLVRKFGGDNSRDWKKEVDIWFAAS